MNENKNNTQKNQKTYFFDAVNALDKSGNIGIHIAVQSRVIGLEQKTSPEGKPLLSGRFPLNGVEKQLNYAIAQCGLYGDFQFPENTGEALWVNVSFWEKTAEYVYKALGEDLSQNVTMSLTGTLKLNKYQSKQNGQTQVGLNLSVKAWQIHRQNQQNQQNQQSQNQNQQAPGKPAGWGQPAAPQQQAPAGWGQPAAPQQQAQASAGWGQPAAPQQQAPAGWGQPAAPQQQAPAGWGQPAAPQQQAPAGWNQQAPAMPEFTSLAAAEDLEGDLPF